MTDHRKGPGPGLRQLAWAWLPAAAYMGLIWILSSLPLEAPAVARFPMRDKGIHFVEYGVLGLLLVHAGLRTWPRHPPLRAAGVGVLVAVAWGLLDECHQALVPGRHAELLDFVADALGALAGAGTLLALRAGRRRFRDRRQPSDFSAPTGAPEER